jgi:hypothetical protein
MTGVDRGTEGAVDFVGFRGQEWDPGRWFIWRSVNMNRSWCLVT